MGTKKQEYLRTIDMLEEIFKHQGIYFALAFLYDAQQERADIKAMLDILEQGRAKKEDKTIESESNIRTGIKSGPHWINKEVEDVNKNGQDKM